MQQVHIVLFSPPATQLMGPREAVELERHDTPPVTLRHDTPPPPPLHACSPWCALAFAPTNVATSRPTIAHNLSPPSTPRSAM